MFGPVSIRFCVTLSLLLGLVGVLNFLPIPILDGGHILLYLVEAIRRRPLSQRAREIATTIGLVLVVLLMLVGLRNDIVRIWMN